MKRTTGLGNALALAFATLPLIVMSWVSYTTSLAAPG
jgi:hypothetical protein